ncbi:hypothetical protein [Alteribacter aurantiacus]|uniref:hypothetical protein n=1 Tax=Alteribacter aurantiacus TaxID=254410 RepID=UPI00040FB5E8|nr:hypothetical protein [Alteribacter aurantiacus]
MSIVIPGVIGLLSMILMVYIHVLIERVYRQREKTLVVLHFPNLMFTWLMYGVTYITVNGFVFNGLRERGRKEVLLEAFIDSASFIVIAYVVIAPFLRKYLRRYYPMKGTNLVYLKVKNNEKKRNTNT